MSVILQVEHTTVYRYAQPVVFGEHRVMFRPREAHDLRVLDASIEVSPEADIRWIHDVFSNSVTLVMPREPADELKFVARFTIEHFGAENFELPLTPEAENYPFSYSSEDRIDLGALLVPQHGDAEGLVQGWANTFIPVQGSIPARQMLSNINSAIRDGFVYNSRETEGTQTPTETLRLKSGTCRDFALLMVEAVRRLGFAARFVSGYLYDPALDEQTEGEGEAKIGAGATHAWLHVYLPGAGWVPFDPTNRLTGGYDLIRVATVRDPFQAAPIAGTFTGVPGDFLGMTVDVKVRRIAVLEHRTL